MTSMYDGTPTHYSYSCSIILFLVDRLAEVCRMMMNEYYSLDFSLGTQVYR